MKRVEVLIEQALRTPSKSVGCGCGCGCGGKKKNSPILKEGKVKHLLSEGLNYHIDKKVPLFESEYRIGSEAHLSLIREARKLYSRGIIEVSEMDARLLETDLGHFGDYEGEMVPLDLPMLNEQYDGVDFENEFEVRDVLGKFGDKATTMKLDLFNHYLKTKTNYNPISMGTFKAAQKALKSNLNPKDEFPEISKLDFSDRLKNRAKDTNKLPNLKESELEEAEYQGKEVQLNKPKRGGSKAYYVYVKDPKTKKVKKVSFGSGGLRAKLSNKEARKNFASRHNCKDKKDRTKAGYWSCNLPRYAKSLGMGANMNTFW